VAIVFSPDVLFVHVPKAGGTSVTQYLLENLTPPVYYVSPGHLGFDKREGLTHIPGLPHKPLSVARDFMCEHGFDLTDFPLILAIVRNPYDIIVSNYAYQQRVVVPYELMNARDAPPRRLTSPRSDLRQAVATMLDALAPGKVARIERERGTSPAVLREEILRVAADRRRPVDVWAEHGVLHVALVPEQETGADHFYTVMPGRRTFRDYLFEEQNDAEKSWLARLFGFYHLDGVVPPNMRVIRFESLGDDLTAALREHGLAFEAELPWLNKSEHAPYASYYDAEIEAIVYEQARWLFDEGYYQRLPVARDHRSDAQRA
jgi:hypothetical protein